KDGDGKVYVALSGGGFLTLLPQVANATPLAGFGWEVASIGDVDDDGVEDIGVGEPYWDNNELDPDTQQPLWPATLATCEALRGDGYTGNCAGRFSVVKSEALL